MDLRLFILITIVGLTHAKAVALSCDKVRMFLDGHNSRRLKLAKGEVSGQPPAAEMKYMIWDEELAYKAQRWASRNEFKHNPDRQVGSARFKTGENIFWISSNAKNFQLDINSVLDSWFDEHNDYTYGPLTSDDFSDLTKQIGHYTQMAWADSMYLGCGVSKRKSDGYTYYLVVCNYGPAGNYYGMAPYKSSKDGSGALVCGSDDCDEKYGHYC